MEVLRMTDISIDPNDPGVQSIGSDGLLVANFVPPKGLWTLGDSETDFPSNLLRMRIAAIIRQPGEAPEVEPPEPPEPPTTGDPEAIIEVNDPWEVDVRWELQGKLKCFICGFWRVKLFLESLGADELDREARYPIDIPTDGRDDSYHAQFKIRPNALRVEPEEGTPFQLTVAVILMVKCRGRLLPGPIIGKVNLPLIQAFTEVVPSPIP
jgi:hypothetical protein